MVNKYCSKCFIKTKRYDFVYRTMKLNDNKKEIIQIERFRCPKCKSIHRVLPSFIYPYKQYKASIINDVINGYIDSDTIGYEDYPCELTMKRWKIYFHRS